MWAAGCILAELLKRKPLFPGADSQQQLELVFDVIGTPTEEEINAIPKSKSRDFIRNYKPRPPKPFEEIFPDQNPLAIDLLKKILVFDPSKRITVEQALEHEYLESYHDEEDEPVTEPVSKFDFDFENKNLTATQLKDQLYEEILCYHFPDKREEYNQHKQEWLKSFQEFSSVETEKTGDLSSSEFEEELF